MIKIWLRVKIFFCFFFLSFAKGEALARFEVSSKGAKALGGKRSLRVVLEVFMLKVGELIGG